MSAKGSSTFSAGLTFGSPFALSAGGRPEAEYFGAPSDGGAEAGGFGAGRAAVALAGGTFVTVGAAGGAVLAGATARLGFRRRHRRLLFLRTERRRGRRGG